MRKNDILLWFLGCVLTAGISIRILSGNLWGYAGFDVFVTNALTSVGGSIINWIHHQFYGTIIPYMLGSEIFIILINSIVIILFLSLLIISLAFLLTLIWPTGNKVPYKTCAVVISSVVFVLATYRVIYMSVRIYNAMPMFLEYGAGTPFMTLISFGENPTFMFWVHVLLYLLLNLLRVLCSYLLASSIYKKFTVSGANFDF